MCKVLHIPTGKCYWLYIRDYKAWLNRFNFNAEVGLTYISIDAYAGENCLRFCEPGDKGAIMEAKLHHFELIDSEA